MAKPKRRQKPIVAKPVDPPLIKAPTGKVPWGPMEGFAVLIAFYLVGDLLHTFGVPLPGSVLGLIGLTIALLVGWVQLHQVEAGARMLLKNILLFFVPAIIGVLGYTTLFTEHGLAIISIWLGTLLVVLLSTALTAITFSQYMRPHAE